MGERVHDAEPENTTRILIVDDIPENIRVLSSMLSVHGYEISVATSGKQAISILETVLPDIILLDVRMPGMDGFELCRKLKENEATREIPVIFLSACSETDDVVRGFTFGAADYITKPFQQAELRVRIATHINLRQARQEIIRKNEALEAALAKVKLLEGIIPICMYCKKIRNTKANWQKLEQYISDHSEAQFSHGICPSCYEKAMKEIAGGSVAAP